MLRVAFTPRGRATMKVVEEWRERTAAFEAQLVYYAAQAVKQDLLETIPNTDEWASYRASLEVSSVGSFAPVFAVRVNARRAGTREVDGSTSVLYLERRRRMAQVPVGLTVLEKYQPWTVDTLPFVPKRNEARVVVRRVSENEANRVRRERQRQRRFWERDLAKEGVRLRTDVRSRRVAKQARPDVAFEGLRLEFGGSGLKAKPHWRPALSRIRRSGIASVYKSHPSLRHALTRASFSGWVKWPRRPKRRISVQQARELIAFQRMVLGR